MLFNRACTQKTGFFENLTFSFNFILIVIRHSKNKKKYPRHKIDVKISRWIDSHCHNTYIYIDLHLEILIFLLIFNFTAFPYFYAYSEFRFGFYEKFYTGYSVLKIFFILLFKRVKLWKSVKNVTFFIENRLFLRFFHFNDVPNAKIFKKIFKTPYPV